MPLHEPILRTVALPIAIDLGATSQCKLSVSGDSKMPASDGCCFDERSDAQPARSSSKSAKHKVFIRTERQERLMKTRSGDCPLCVAIHRADSGEKIFILRAFNKERVSPCVHRCGTH